MPLTRLRRTKTGLKLIMQSAQKAGMPQIGIPAPVSALIQMCGITPRAAASGARYSPGLCRLPREPNVGISNTLKYTCHGSRPSFS